ncbi:MAG TPA: alpha/beta hydrolase [Thermomicrobiaceae bacterium]|nr:alpha/beta hydrolase [Thermomicrobiaceae bacterium]
MHAEDVRTVALPDGRQLSYAEYGDPTGRPVLYFHGIPGSRLSSAFADQPARARGVRIIAIDRPGIGRSTFRPGRRFLDWPRDVAALTGALGLETFAVAGVSGGAAYVAACALCLPERISFAGIISGMGPLETPGATSGMRGMTRRRRLEIALARRAPRLTCRLAQGHIARESDPRRGDVIAQMCAEVAPADIALLGQPKTAAAVRRDFAEAFHQGPRGVAWDLILYARPWGFSPRDIPIEVHLWHGDADVTVPIAFGRALAGSIPRCRARYFPGEGHLLAISYIDEMLDLIATRM